MAHIINRGRIHDVQLSNGRVIVTKLGKLYTVEFFIGESEYSRTPRLTKNEALKILADYIQADVMEEN
jgi:hypothetical protein